MDKVKDIIRKKPQLFLLSTLFYVIVTGFVKWQVHPPIEALWYVIGSGLGIYFLDFAEAVFGLSPSPFRSIVFAAAFAGVSFFIVSSSGSVLATGLVLSVYLALILRQIGELYALGTLTSWYTMIASPVSVQFQKYGLAAFLLFFVIQTVLFIRTR
jgi:hypothetical protein